MNYEEFVCRVQAEVKARIGEGARVERRRITKNNGVELEGLAIRREGEKISPMIYLEEYFALCKRGMATSQITEDILQLYERSLENIPKDTRFYTDFERVKKGLACRLINYEKNREQLREVPHICCLDLALVFYYVMEEQEMGRGTILIYNSHLEMWGITKEKLCEAARKNTPELFPPEFAGMEEILGEAFREREGEEEDRLPMYVLTNRERRFGAVNILYDGVLAEIAEKLQDDLYILPSSVHECIIVPRCVSSSQEELEEMVRSINCTQVLPEEVLSDHVYCYEREEHRLRMCYGSDEAEP